MWATGRLPNSCLSRVRRWKSARLLCSAGAKKLHGCYTAQAQARGAHGIPLMSHVALGGDVAVAEVILAQGAQDKDVMDSALYMAVAAGQEGMVRWLLENNLADVH